LRLRGSLKLEDEDDEVSSVVKPSLLRPYARVRPPTPRLLEFALRARLACEAGEGALDAVATSPFALLSFDDVLLSLLLEVFALFEPAAGLEGPVPLLLLLFGGGLDLDESPNEWPRIPVE
jgi:hypothetical protein